MQDKFYIHHKEQNMGPLTVDEILKKLDSSEILITDYIYLDDKKDWVSLIEASFISEKVKIKTQMVAKPTLAEHTNTKGSTEKQEWFVLKWDNKYGPFSYMDIIKMLQSKSIFEFDYVWKSEFDNWKRVAEVPEFKQDSVKELFKSNKEFDEKNVFFRRRHERVTFNGSILVHDNNNVWKGSAIEISEEGAGLVMHNSMITPGQSIYLHFKPGDSVPPFNAVCEVVSKGYIKDVKDKNAPIKYGVKFLKIQPGTKKAIKKYIMEKVS